MKNKLVLCLLIAIASLSCFFVTACGKQESDDKNAEIYAVYQIYSSAEEEKGNTPLSYEQWLNSLKGKVGDAGNNGANGVSIVKIEKTYSDGLSDTYTVTFSNGETSAFVIAIGKNGAKGDKGEDGKNGTNGKSAYEIWLEAGNIGTEEDFLNFIKGENGAIGTDGKSAFEIWILAGNNGTEEDFLNFIKGENGTNGTDGVNGTNGKSAYEIWLEAGNNGTEADFLNFIKGESGANVLLRINESNKWEVSFDGGKTYEELNVFATGANGNNGTNGTNGTDGVNGADGVTPRLRINENSNLWEVSYNGGESWSSLGVTATGSSGANGSNGTNGTNGVNGADGKSAYEIWKDAGNNGTEEDFIYSLKGAAGSNGVLIKDVSVHYDGRLYITLTDNRVIDAGSIRSAHPHSVTEKEIIKTEATCDHVGVKYIVCETCGEVVKTVIIEKLPHDYVGENYAFNDHFHWRETNCVHDEPVDKGEHTLVNGVCSVCGYNVKSTAALRYQAINGGTEYAVTGLEDDSISVVYIPSSYNGKPVTKIGADAFKNKTAINTLILSANVTAIESGAFSGCTGLINVYYEGSAAKWNSVSIGGDNAGILGAAVYTYLSYQPTYEGQFWHYASDNVTPIVWEYGDWTVSY